MLPMSSTSVSACARLSRTRSHSLPPEASMRSAASRASGSPYTHASPATRHSVHRRGEPLRVVTSRPHSGHRPFTGPPSARAARGGFGGGAPRPPAPPPPPRGPNAKPPQTPIPPPPPPPLSVL